MQKVLLITIVLIILFTGCRNTNSGKSKEIIIFHAGSLSVPFKQIKEEYQRIHPEVKILLESAGSLVCARKITELKKPCDIIASADYFVINELIVPDYSNWSIRFATNEIVVAYHDKSKYASDINSENWIEILSRDDVIYARSDPDSDPCGYRSVMTFMLAEKYYNLPGLKEKMVSKNIDFIRPKEVDLIALVESNSIDYMFQYKSVAIQHNLKFVELPAEINLSDPTKEDIYESVSLEVTGNKPGTTITVKGEYINYSMTVLDKAPMREEAIDFMGFILSEEGLDIFRKNGQNPIIPFSSENYENIPTKLLDYLPDYKVSRLKNE